MRQLVRYALIAAALGVAAPALAQGTGARPADSTANRPSESGAQSTTPPGAVTGAGQPQGGQQVEAPGSAKAKSGTGAKTTKKHAKKKKARKHRQAKSTTG